MRWDDVPGRHAGRRRDRRQLRLGVQRLRERLGQQLGGTSGSSSGSSSGEGPGAARAAAAAAAGRGAARAALPPRRTLAGRARPSACSASTANNANAGCDDIESCTSTGWSYPPPGIHLPGCSATCPGELRRRPQGQSCPALGLDCSYSEGQCNCAPLLEGASAGPVWQCSAPAGGCPEPRADLGTACTQERTVVRLRRVLRRHRRAVPERPVAGGGHGLPLASAGKPRTRRPGSSAARGEGSGAPTRETGRSPRRARAAFPGSPAECPASWHDARSRPRATPGAAPTRSPSGRRRRSGPGR